MAGSAIVLYEGKPVGTPDAGIVWRLVEEYKINVIFTAPTALRAIRRADQGLDLLKKVGKRGGMRSLRALWLTGERSQPAVVETYVHQPFLPLWRCSRCARILTGTT
jgi:propionyl-CoA synthetase